MAGSITWCFYSDCDLKLFGTAVCEYLIDGSSKILAVSAGHQLSNGLVEFHWKVMLHMGWAYLTEKRMPWIYWIFAITHAARMMNAILGKIHGHLASPFHLLHGIGHDERTWIPLFSLYFFHHDKDSPMKGSKHQAHTMDGIVVGRSPTSNVLLFYNPQNKQYYELDSHRLNSYQLPSLVYSDVKYDGILFCYLLRDDNPSMEEKYPPGTRVERMDPSTNILVAGMVMDIPFSGDVLDSSNTATYTILFDNGKLSSILLSEMASIIPSPPVRDKVANNSNVILPPFLQLNLKITHDHEGQYHKGFLTMCDGVYCFMHKSHVNKHKEDCSVALPNLTQAWVVLCIECILVPGHIAHSFLLPSSTPNQSAFNPVASFVSAINLHQDFPPSLLKALAVSHPDWEV
jgi:hypothetical protein